MDYFVKNFFGPSFASSLFNFRIFYFLCIIDRPLCNFVLRRFFVIFVLFFVSSNLSLFMLRKFYFKFSEMIVSFAFF